MHANVIEPLAPLWYLHIDEATNEQGCGADLILTTSKLECINIEYTLHLSFKEMKNGPSTTLYL